MRSFSGDGHTKCPHAVAAEKPYSWLGPQQKASWWACARGCVRVHGAAGVREQHRAKLIYRQDNAIKNISLLYDGK